MIDGSAGAAEAISNMRSLLMQSDSRESSRSSRIVGLDCEWGRVLKGKKLRGVDLVQIAPTTRLQDSVIFRCVEGVPGPLKEFLEDPGILKVVVGVMDTKVLWRSGVCMKGSVDLQRVVHFLGIADEHGNSLAGLYRGFCGKELDKSEQRSDWRADDLSEKQISYAAQDAVASLELIYALSARHMPEGSRAAEFAALFVDSFAVKNTELQRETIKSAVASLLKRSDLPSNVRTAMQKISNGKEKEASSDSMTGAMRGRDSEGIDVKTAKTNRTNTQSGRVTAFYAVAKGRVPGIYKTWKDCQAQVVGFSSPKFKKFDTESEAAAFVSAV